MKSACHNHTSSAYDFSELMGGRPGLRQLVMSFEGQCVWENRRMFLCFRWCGVRHCTFLLQAGRLRPRYMFFVKTVLFTIYSPGGPTHHRSGHSTPGIVQAWYNNQSEHLAHAASAEGSIHLMEWSKACFCLIQDLLLRRAHTSHWWLQHPRNVASLVL